MRLYLAILFVLVALLVTFSGVAAITRGWVPPWLRSSVRRVRLYGLGQLVVAFGLCWYAAFWTVFSDSEWGDGFGFPLVATGSILMVVGRNTGRNRQGTGMP
ncbi:hypothetical protein ACFCYB_36210 [Streptomyces sp. NPDC056309]|uniref:hypothetical protein n=1 Tax=unclassified Streptomyces TaxID=2593676 RepID=UPI0035D788ED